MSLMSTRKFITPFIRDDWLIPVQPLESILLPSLLPHLPRPSPLLSLNLKLSQYLQPPNPRL